MPGLGKPRPPGKAPGKGEQARAPGVTPVELGTIRVTLAPSDGAVVAKTVRVEIEALGPALSTHPLAVPQQDGTYLFERVPTGRYRLRAMSEGSQEAVAQVAVEKDVEAAVEILLKPGADASYAVSLYSGESPATVTLALLDGRGLPVSASFQTSATTIHLPPDRGAGMPPTGKVIGLKPGRYTLRATSLEGETDEKTFDAKAGEVVALELRIRK